MRVIIPCSGYGRVFRGIEKWVEGISKELSKKGIEVYIICGQNTKQKLNDIKICRFPIVKRESLIYKQRPFEEISALLESLSLSLSSYPFVRRFKFDVMLSSQWSDLYISLLFKKVKNFKHIFCFHSTPRKLTKLLYLPLTWSSADIVVSVNNFVKKRVKETLGIESKVIYNGVNTRLFSPSNISQSEKNETIFLYVGALLKKKGIYTLLEAMKSLKLEKRLKLWIVGSGPEKNRIKIFINREKMRNVKFLGKVEDKKLPEIYRASDIVVVPSEYPEAFPIVTAEAIACGKPIIASNIGGLYEIVKKSKGGLLFEPGNKEELTEKMLTLATDFKKRKLLGKNGRKFAERELDWSKVAEKYIKLMGD